MISTKLRVFRKQFDLSTDELSATLQIPASVIESYEEKGTSFSSPEWSLFDLVSKIVDSFPVNADYFFGLTDILMKSVISNVETLVKENKEISEANKKLESELDNYRFMVSILQGEAQNTSKLKTSDFSDRITLQRPNN